MSYDGGKGGAGVAQWIINQVPPHRRWVSLFLGNCAITRTIRPAETRIGVEIDREVVQTFWRDTRDLTVICGDALEALKTLKSTRQIDAQTFLYADPPYLLSTRSSQRPIYRHEFGEIEQHRQLLTALRKLPCMVAISGYWSALYEMELAGWRASQFQTVNRAGKPAEEWLWMNYPEPIELHDYRFLGSNFRERERIKRKKVRWTARLARMDSLERLCLMEAVAELRASITGNGDVDERDPGSIATNGELAQHLVGSPEAAMAAATDGNDDAPAPLDLAMVPG
jgi:DNA adenine methylase